MSDPAGFVPDPLTDDEREAIRVGLLLPEPERTQATEMTLAVIIAARCEPVVARLRVAEAERDRWNQRAEQAALTRNEIANQRDDEFRRTNRAENERRRVQVENADLRARLEQARLSQEALRASQAALQAKKVELEERLRVAERERDREDAIAGMWHKEYTALRDATTGLAAEVRQCESQYQWIAERLEGLSE